MPPLLEDEYYNIASNPTRRRILHSLKNGERSFSDLMRSVSMDPEHDTGPFLFHIHKLEEMGLVAGKNGRYSLVGRGEEVSENISFVGKRLKGVEEVSVKGLEIDLESVEPRIGDGWVRINKDISIRREEETGLVIGPPRSKPRTMDVYLPTGRSKTRQFPGKEYETHQFLEEATWGKEKCWVSLSKRYCTNYMGLESHLTSGRAHLNPDGYYLDNWLKVWCIARTSGEKTRFFTVKQESWSVQGKEENPEVILFEPPQASSQVHPLSKETLTWGVRREQHGMTVGIKSGYLGEYTVRVGRKEERQLGKRSLVTNYRDGKVFSQWVNQSYGPVWARYHPPETHKKWGDKNWENSPVPTVDGKDFYMTEETYIARTLKY